VKLTPVQNLIKVLEALSSANEGNLPGEGVFCNTLGEYWRGVKYFLQPDVFRNQADMISPYMYVRRS